MSEAMTARPQETYDYHVSTDVMSLALDGLLDSAERRRFDEHLHGCEVCRGHWSKWQRISTVMQVEPFVGPAPGFALRLNQRFNQRQQRRERVLGGVVLIGGTLSIWTLLLLGLVLTTSVWLAVRPDARVEAIEYFGFGGQLIAVLINNLSPLRDALFALVPGPAVIMAVGCALAVAGLVWMKLVLFRSAPSNGLTGNAGASANGSFHASQDQ